QRDLERKAQNIEDLRKQALAANADAAQRVLYAAIEGQPWTEAQKASVRTRVDSFILYLRTQPVALSELIFTPAQLRQMFTASKASQDIKDSLMYMVAGWLMQENGPVMIQDMAVLFNEHHIDAQVGNFQITPGRFVKFLSLGIRSPLGDGQQGFGQNLFMSQLIQRDMINEVGPDQYKNEREYVIMFFDEGTYSYYDPQTDELIFEGGWAGYYEHNLSGNGDNYGITGTGKLRLTNRVRLVLRGGLLTTERKDTGTFTQHNWKTNTDEDIMYGYGIREKLTFGQIGLEFTSPNNPEQKAEVFLRLEQDNSQFNGYSWAMAGIRGQTPFSIPLGLDSEIPGMLKGEFMAGGSYRARGSIEFALPRDVSLEISGFADGSLNARSMMAELGIPIGREGIVVLGAGIRPDGQPGFEFVIGQKTGGEVIDVPRYSNGLAMGFGAASYTSSIPYPQPQDVSRARVTHITPETVRVDQARGLTQEERWLLQQAETPTGLTEAYEGDGVNYNLAFLRTDVLRALVAIRAGRFDEARGVFEVYNGVYERYIKQNPNSPFLGFAYARDINSPSSKAEEMAITVDEAMLGLAIFEYYRATGDARFIPMAEACVGFPIIKRSWGREKLTGWQGGYMQYQSKTTGAIPAVLPLSNPNVLVARVSDQPVFAALLGRLAQYYAERGDQPKAQAYRTAQAKVMEYLAREGWNAQLGRFNQATRETTTKRFLSTHTDITTFSGFSAAAQLNPIVYLGFEGLQAVTQQNGRSVAENLLAQVRRECLVETGYQFEDGAVVQIRGFDYVNAQGALQARGLSADGRTPKRTISVEITTLVIDALKLFGDKYRTEVNSYLQELGKLKRHYSSGVTYVADTAG
ncbi:MAG: hypothetical protein PHP35_03085, partial [Candidatus Colwellbacteria bacterium]|nr:hypothetical protein [Candidatus Colwellbacteria bacterium]